MTPLEVQAITQNVLKEFSADQEKRLPQLMAPLMYEVAEKIAARSEAAQALLLSNIFGLDITDKEKVATFQRDLFWLRDKRVESEAERKIIRHAVTVGTLKALFMGIIGAATALLAVLGLKGT